MSNPFSTGGWGTVFELKVQNSLLAKLLVSGHVPAFENALIEELHLRAEHLGYETDDALAICLHGDGLQRKQLWSVKHEVKFAERDEVFQDVVADAWADFLDTKRFNHKLDAFFCHYFSAASTATRAEICAPNCRVFCTVVESRTPI